MAKTESADPTGTSIALSQLRQMIIGAECELSSGRPHASGTLAVAGAVRAVDLICDASLGHHSIAANHRDAIVLLATIPGIDDLVEDFSLCHTHKTGFNYAASNLDHQDAKDVLDAARRLFAKAIMGIKEAGWFPEDLDEDDFDLFKLE